MSNKGSGLLSSSWFPVVPQIVFLGAFIALIAGGWNITSNDAVFLKTLRNTNLANLIVWSFWWPAVVVMAVAFGRIWCMVCPMELISTTLNRIGLKLRPPRFIRSGWIITLLYVVAVIIGVHTFAIHRVPHRMALYLLSLLGLAVAVSLVFRQRAFCSYFCPVGLLLGLYSLVSSAEWRVKDRGRCKACRDKPCINPGRRNNWYGRACQSGLYPPLLSDNKDCLLCTQCYKACNKGNISFHWRRPFRDLLGNPSLQPAAVAFLVVVFAFAFSEVFELNARCDEWMKALPAALNGWLGTPAPWNGTIEALVLFVAIPLLVLIVASLLQSWFSQKRVRPFLFSAYALGLVPLAALTHFSKGLLKSVSRLQYLPGALGDPAGIHTAERIVAKQAAIGGAWQMHMDQFMQVAAAGLIITGGVLSVIVTSRIAHARKEARPVVFWALGLLYSLALAAALLTHTCA